MSCFSDKKGAIGRNAAHKNKILKIPLKRLAEAV